MHNPFGISKSEYMRVRRNIGKLMAETSSVNKPSSHPSVTSADVANLVSQYSTNPQLIQFQQVRGASETIQELLNITQGHFPISFTRLEKLNALKMQSNISVFLVFMATHYLLGTTNEAQTKKELASYDLKKDSQVWFTQLLFTISRYEAFAMIAEKASQRKTRSDKNMILRLGVKKELDILKSQGKKINQAAIARKYNLSKQRIGQIVREL